MLQAVDFSIKLDIWLSDFLSMITLALIFSPLMPSTIPIALMGTLIHYKMNKTLIIKLSKQQNFSCKQIAFMMYEKFILLVIFWCFSFVVFWNNISNDYHLGAGNSSGLILTVIILCPISWIMAKLCVDNIETLENSSRRSRYTVKGG